MQNAKERDKHAKCLQRGTNTPNAQKIRLMSKLCKMRDLQNAQNGT